MNRLEQVTIEDKYSKHNAHELLRADLSSMSKELELGEKILTDYILGRYYPSKNKRVSNLLEIDLDDVVMGVMLAILPYESAQTIQSICGRVWGSLNQEDVFLGVKTAAELVTVLSNTGLYYIIPARDADIGSIMVQSNVTLDTSTLQKLADIKYLPPMICKPNLITSNGMSPYLTKGFDSVILGSGNHHDEHQSLDVLNISSSVCLSLDEDMLQYEEKSKKELDTPEKIANFERLRSSSRKVYEDLIDQGNEFYLTYKFCTRGREYSQGYHVNHQSTEFKKAIINLTKQEVITL